MAAAVQRYLNCPTLILHSDIAVNLQTHQNEKLAFRSFLFHLAANFCLDMNAQTRNSSLKNSIDTLKTSPTHPNRVVSGGFKDSILILRKTHPII